MADSEAEAWRPPLFASRTGFIPDLLAAVRRFFDIQAGSVWRDLRPILQSVEGTVVDVGCGAQPYRRLLPRSVTYVGIDTAAAKSDFGYQVPDTLCFSGDTWPIADQSADVILCTETMEHVFDTRQFLGEVSRCLASAGLLIATVPFSARWHFIPHDYWRFTPSTLQNLLREAGFHQIRIYARGNEFTVAAYKVMALILKYLMPQHASAIGAIAGRIAGLVLLPCLFFLAVIANISLRTAGGDDCLGYTILAARTADSKP
jgi:SAM-dependent methyltransferase